MKNNRKSNSSHSHSGNNNNNKPSNLNAFKLKVVKPTLSNVATYEFECGLSPDFLDSLSVQVGLSGTSEGKQQQQQQLSVDDDLKLEAYFLQQALAAVSAGRSRLESCGRIFTRPSTYHAHLLKTVSHLQRIEKAETAARKDLEASAVAKRQRLLKATAKKVQVETIQGREKARSEDKKKIEQIRKRKPAEGRADGKGGEGKGEDFDVETVVEDVINGKQRNNPHHNNNTQNHTKSTSTSTSTSANYKRQGKDKKFGFGGKDRKLAKRNTKASVNNLSQFSKYNAKPRVNKAKKGRGGAAGRGGRK